MARTIMIRGASSCVGKSAPCAALCPFGGETVTGMFRMKELPDRCCEASSRQVPGEVS